jgi:hypothetical protein
MKDSANCKKKFIIPDDSVKISNLNLDNTKNGIIINAERKRDKDYLEALETILSKSKNNLPITMRKLLLYQQRQNS